MTFVTSDLNWFLILSCDSKFDDNSWLQWWHRNWFLFFADVRLQLNDQLRCLDSRLEAQQGQLVELQDIFRWKFNWLSTILRRTFISSTWKAPHSHSQTESRDRVELLAGLGEAEQVGDQQAQGAEDQEGALELAFFNRDMETACGRDQESWQVHDVIFHHHHHQRNPPCHQSASSLKLSASSLLFSASLLLMSFLCSWSSLSIHRDHAAMAEIYSGNIMVSAINFF